MSENKLELTGQISLIKPTEEFAGGFTKRIFVITTDDKFPQEVAFELIKDDTSQIEEYSIGDGITVSFNVRGNEFKGKHYVNLKAWRIVRNPGAGEFIPSEEEPSNTELEKPNQNETVLSGSASEEDEEVPW
jgi:hypothetical protein